MNATGRFVRQPSGYRVFIPAPLPPDPPINLDNEAISLLSSADQAIGRLDGATQMLPNPDLFVAMNVRQEAVASSAIEGTQSTLQDVLAFELDPRTRDLPNDVEEVVNYVRAMNFGLERLSTLPLSLRLIREIHAELMAGVRGQEHSPGEFRKTQNWIGRPGATLSTATFVPPSVPEMHECLNNLEGFLHARGTMPVLVHAAIAHSQFETIHPFLDGNGRVGRLLIAFMLVHEGSFHRPLLYLSHYFKSQRQRYYAHLMNVRTSGDWLPWIKFFLDGVDKTAKLATNTAQDIIRMREDNRSLVQAHLSSSHALTLLDLLFERPLVNSQLVAQTVSVSDVTARGLMERFASIGLLREITGKSRNRVYRYEPYWRIFEDTQAASMQEAGFEETLSESSTL